MTFRSELNSLINRHSKENGSNTPDFVIADYLIQCLQALDIAVNTRDRWRDNGNGTFSVRVEMPTTTADEGK